MSGAPPILERTGFGAVMSVEEIALPRVCAACAGYAGEGSAWRLYRPRTHVYSVFICAACLAVAAARVGGATFNRVCLALVEPAGCA